MVDVLAALVAAVVAALPTEANRLKTRLAKASRTPRVKSMGINISCHSST
jgi:hypothetical protein